MRLMAVLQHTSFGPSEHGKPQTGEIEESFLEMDDARDASYASAAEGSCFARTLARLPISWLSHMAERILLGQKAGGGDYC